MLTALSLTTLATLISPADRANFKAKGFMLLHLEPTFRELHLIKVQKALQDERDSSNEMRMVVRGKLLLLHSFDALTEDSNEMF